MRSRGTRAAVQCWLAKCSKRRAWPWSGKTAATRAPVITRAALPRCGPSEGKKIEVISTAIVASSTHGNDSHILLPNADVRSGAATRTSRVSAGRGASCVAVAMPRPAPRIRQRTCLVQTRSGPELRRFPPWTWQSDAPASASARPAGSLIIHLIPRQHDRKQQVAYL